MKPRSGVTSLPVPPRLPDGEVKRGLGDGGWQPTPTTATGNLVGLVCVENKQYHMDMLDFYFAKFPL